MPFKPTKKQYLVSIVLFGVIFVFVTGMHYGSYRAKRITDFHDTQVIHPKNIMKLIDDHSPEIKRLAKSLKTPENAYHFVRDNIAFEPSLPTAGPSVALAEGRASCLGKAVLLCSLYRAMGISSSKVRIVMGEVNAEGTPIDHAWVEMEHNGVCVQQDVTDLLGRFAFAQFVGTEYTRNFIREENYVFNDSGFAIVSQLNRFRDSGGMPVEMKKSMEQLTSQPAPSK